MALAPMTTSPPIERSVPPSSRLALDFCGLKLNSPVVLLSGCVAGENQPAEPAEPIEHPEVSS